MEDFYIKSNKKEYFNTKGMIEKYPNCQFYIVVGQRSNGKSYSTLKYLVDEYFKSGNQFMYLRRFDENVKARMMKNVFSDLEEYIKSEYNHEILFYNGSWYVIPSDLEKKASNGEIIGYAQSINNTEKLKSLAFPKVGFIIFEEFIATMGYITDEVNLLMQIISTVFRDRINGKIFLLGNSISKTSPYTESLGISIKDFPKGETKVISSIQGEVETSILVHRCRAKKKENKSKRVKIGYTAFGSTNFGEMIHDGDFECREGIRHINGITLQQYIKFVPRTIKVNTSILKATTLYIKYLDVTYRFYFGKINGVGIGGFTKEEVGKKEKNILISSNLNDMNPKYNYKFINNISRLGKLETNVYVTNLVSELNDVITSGRYVTLDDDMNEDILRAFENVI